MNNMRKKINNIFNWITLCCLLGCFLSLPNSTTAGGKLTAEDLKRLPEICLYTYYGIFAGKDYGTMIGSGGIVKRKNKSPEHKKLYNYYIKYGPDLLHMHHYCTALKSLREAFSSCGTSKLCKEGKIKSAIGDFNYILSKSKKDFILRPFLFEKAGDYHLLLGNNMNAIQMYQSAIKENPKYVPGYISLYHLFKALNDHENAGKAIDYGLRFSPDSKDLLNLKAGNK